RERSPWSATRPLLLHLLPHSNTLLVGLRPHLGCSPVGGKATLRARLKAHRRRSRLVQHPQGAVFAAASALLCSWVINGAWKEHQRLEFETHLIGAHVQTVGEVPSGQFLG